MRDDEAELPANADVDGTVDDEGDATENANVDADLDRGRRSG